MAYEQFTGRARRVMALANEEAQRFRHEYVEPEYLLLGLVKEGVGVAAIVLKSLDICHQKVCDEVEKIRPIGTSAYPKGWLPQSPRVRKVMEYAMEESQNLNHNYVGTEHILLGLLREPEGVAARILTTLGLQLEAIRHEVLNLLGDGTNVPSAIIPAIAISKSRLESTAKQATEPESDAEPERLSKETETAVGNQDFEEALILRNRIDEFLRKRKEIEPLDPKTIAKIRAYLRSANQMIDKALQKLEDR